MGIVEVGEKHRTEEEEKKKRSVKTMASYACNRHHGWRTQAAWINFTLFMCIAFGRLVAVTITA